ncbi:MAG: hypothetical protein KME03_08385 [Aphanocapsa lilacina HA4352-LM1]|nr:hypothetical protein [Aphanocapsa lilacina HA4352-LM1]
MKSPEADPLLGFALGAMTLAVEATLRLAGAAQRRLLEASAESKQYLGSRLLPEVEDT